MLHAVFMLGDLTQTIGNRYLNLHRLSSYYDETNQVR